MATATDLSEFRLGLATLARAAEKIAQLELSVESAHSVDRSLAGEIVRGRGDGSDEIWNLAKQAAQMIGQTILSCNKRKNSAKLSTGILVLRPACDILRHCLPSKSAGMPSYL